MITVSGYPMRERGYYHLTELGWMRQDQPPFPPDRIQTWIYEMECQAEDAKQSVCLTRIWNCPDLPADALALLQRRHGSEPFAPSPRRNITMECNV